MSKKYKVEAFDVRRALVIGLIVGFVIGAFIAGNYHTCPTTYPTRPEMQMFLRENYGYRKSIDGDIGDKSNDAWLLYEQDLMNEDMARYIEKMGGIKTGANYD